METFRAKTFAFMPMVTQDFREYTICFKPLLTWVMIKNVDTLVTAPNFILHVLQLYNTDWCLSMGFVCCSYFLYNLDIDVYNTSMAIFCSASWLSLYHLACTWLQLPPISIRLYMASYASFTSLYTSLVPRPHPRGEGLVTSGWFLGLH